MHLRAVIVTIAPGQTEAYWEWARDIVALWDAHGIRRASGPFRAKAADGADMAVWTTAHDTLEEIEGEFREMYATDRGRELIAQRPPLVSHTALRIYEQWDGTGQSPEWKDPLTPD